MRSPSFKDHFSATASAYARFRPTYPPALVEFLATSAVTPGTVWDVGCGSGQLSIPLAEAFEQVVATDASQAQIDQASPHPKIEYRVARAEDSGLPSCSVDLVVAAQAAHWFDLPAFYSEVRRVARPDAVIALVTYGRFRFDRDIDDVIEDLYTRVLGAYWPPERKLVEQDYRTLLFPFPELPVPVLAIERRLDRSAVLANIGTWSAVAQLRAAQGSNAELELDRFATTLATAWPNGEREAHWPLTIRMGRVVHT